ncbi:MAG: hypothetical protein R3F31_25360 [Verrucomicrobiales bacterium]
MVRIAPELNEMLGNFCQQRHGEWLVEILFQTLGQSLGAAVAGSISIRVSPGAPTVSTRS